MDKVEQIINDVNMVNQALPALSGLILSIKHPSGEIEVLTSLDASEARADDNIAKAQAFIAAHQS